MSVEAVNTVSNAPGAWTVRARTAETSWEAALWSETGQRVRFKAALKHLDMHAGDSLLDFGCGTGALSELIPAGVEYLGVDSSPGMLQRARREHPTREFDYRLPYSQFTHTAAIGVWNLASWEEAVDGIYVLWGMTTKIMVASIHRELASPAQIAERFSEHGAMLKMLVDCSYKGNDSMLILRR